MIVKKLSNKSLNNPNTENGSHLIATADFSEYTRWLNTLYNTLLYKFINEFRNVSHCIVFALPI